MASGASELALQIGNMSATKVEAKRLRYSHFFHLKMMYGTTAAITIMLSASG